MTDHLKYIDYLKGESDSIRSLTDQLPIGIYRTSVDGKILYANPALAKMLELSIEEIYKLAVYDLFVKKEQRENEVKSLMKEPKDKTTSELLLKTKSGRIINVKDTVNVIKDKNGRIKYFDGVLEDITAQKEAENALKESETRFKILTDITIEGIIIHSSGIIKDVNPAAQKITGFTSEQAIGKSILQFIHVDYHEFVKSILDTNYSGIFELEIICADKSNLLVEVESKNVIINNEKHSVVAFRDISKRKSIEQELLSLSTVVKQSPVSIVITGTDGNIEYVNPKFCEITGYSVKEVIGQNPRILKSEHTKTEDYKDMWETISSGGTWRGEFRNKRKDGSNYWELASISPIIDDTGRTIKYLAVKEDITERKITEEALKKSEKELSESNATKNMFFSIMAHDLKGPIGSFLQLLNLLKENFNDISNFERLDYVNILINLSSKTNNLLEDILMWARIQMNTIDFKPENINLETLINKSINIVEEKAKEKSIQIKINIDNNITVIANEDSLQTVFRNVLSNAIKFSHKNSEVQIISKLDKSKENVEISIIDQGIGIPADYVNKLFKIETTFSTYGTEKEKGTGLGLILCKELIIKNNGDIWATSEENKGSTFTVKVPIKK